MSPRNMTEIEKLIDAQTDIADFDGPLPQYDLVQAENLLGVAFPGAYRHFLLRYGVGAFGATEIYGLIAGKVPAKSIPCTVFATLEERKSSDFPSDFVVIGASGYGPLFCLAVSEASEDDCPVREWNYTKVARDSSSLVSPSFAAYLEKVVESEIG